MENKFHKTLLRLIGVEELLLSIIGVALIYLSHAQPPSFLGSMENALATLSVLFPPSKPLYVGMMAATGLGLIAVYRWAWWAEINLILVRIALLSLALYWSHELASMVRLFNPLVIQLYLAFTVAILVYLIYFKARHQGLLKETPATQRTMMIFTVLTFTVLIITIKKYYSFLHG